MTDNVRAILDAKLARILADASHDNRHIELFGAKVEEYDLDLDNYEVQRAIRAMWAVLSDIQNLMVRQIESAESALDQPIAEFDEIVNQAENDDIAGLVYTRMQEYEVDPESEQITTAMKAMTDIIGSVLNWKANTLEQMFNAAKTYGRRQPKKSP
jgi:hypothetical protein